MQLFAIAKYPTPILNRPDFSYVFGECPQGILLEKELNLLKSLEMIAFPGEVFTVIHKHPLIPYIYEVKMASYPVKQPIYVDERFLEFYDKEPFPPLVTAPSLDEILTKMESFVGLPYIWGGNYSQGIEKMMNLYPPKKDLSVLESANWIFKGVDCSGMLYEATRGFTPRNSSWLACYGEGLSVKGLKNEEIKKLLKPLDMILWEGHVLFILDDHYTIESRAHIGCVFITKIAQRLEQIRIEEKKYPMNNSQDNNYKENGFIIRRWHSGY